MASLIRRKYRAKDKDGNTYQKQSPYWYVDYIDANGKRKRQKAYKDKVASLQLAARLEKDVELAKEGVIDKYAGHRKMPLTEHLEAYKKNLINKGSSEKHIDMTYMRVKAMIANCKFTFITEVQPSIVLNELAKLRNSKNQEKDLSIQSKNYYLKALKSFFNWMVEDQRIGENPINHLKCQNADVDIKRKRRALDDEELSKLIKSTMGGLDHHGMTGQQRAMVYILAVNTGFRAREIASLTWGAFDFNDIAPTVTIQAGYSKRRRNDVQPLRHDIAKLFQGWKCERGESHDDKVFRPLKYMRWADMIRKDMELAGLSYLDEAGRVADFHALRHTYVTNLVKGGASPKIAQSLARHSKIELTMNTYTHLSLHDHRQALEALPGIPGVNDQENNQAVAAKTGTDDAPVKTSDSNCQSVYTPVYTKLAKTAYSGCQGSSMIGSGAGEQKQEISLQGEVDKSLEMSHLGQKNNPLSSSDNGLKWSEAEGTRTLNLRIDSPML